MTLLRYLYIVLLTLCVASTTPLKCKDDNNKPVDWYVVYKLPKVPESQNPLLKNGLAYLYITSNHTSSGWKLSEKDIGRIDSMPGNTLSVLYNDTEAAKKVWFMYNDDPPNKTVRSTNGHAKGVVISDVSRGLWLIHSVPNYPPVPNTGNDTRSNSNNDDKVNDKLSGKEYFGKYGYPTSGTTYGQSFLCISLNSDQMDTIGRQLMYNQIIVYRKNLPEQLSKAFPVLTSAANEVRLKTAPYNRQVQINSSSSFKFISFAKSSKWQRDLYDDFVAPSLKSDILTETWLNGPGKLPSECNGTKVLNVESVVLKVPDMNLNVNFSSSRDHSKWAVSMENVRNKNWVCVGDINRASTQYNRGGGTVCFNMRNVWKTYRNSVNDVESCEYKKKTN